MRTNRGVVSRDPSCIVGLKRCEMVLLIKTYEIIYDNRFWRDDWAGSGQCVGIVPVHEVWEIR